MRSYLLHHKLQLSQVCPEIGIRLGDHLGIIEYSFTGEQTLSGKLSWDMKLPTGFLQVFVSVELAGFEEYLEFSISAFGDNPVEVEAYMVLKVAIIQPLEIHCQYGNWQIRN